MPPQPQQPKNEFVLLAVLYSLALALIIAGLIALSLGWYWRYINLGEKILNGILGGQASGQTVNCVGNGDVKVDQAYLPWIQDAANKWLGGDQAALIALIQVESGWNPTASNKDSSARGLGQFLTKTARSRVEFIGGDDGTGKIWSPGTIYDADNSADSRYDAERSIYAAAHYLGELEQQPSNHGDPIQAYYNNYHGGKDSADQSATDKLRSIYNDLLNGGGCTQTGSSGNGSGGGSTTAPSNIAEKIASIAEGYVGQKTTPIPGSDENAFGCDSPRKSCASFVSTVLRQAGLQIPFEGTTTQLWNVSGGTVIIQPGQTADLSKLQRGDVVWFGNGSTASYSGALFNHVGIYVGNGMIVDTSSSAEKVEKRSIQVHYGRGGAGPVRGAKRFGS